MSSIRPATLAKTRSKASAAILAAGQATGGVERELGCLGPIAVVRLTGPEGSRYLDLGRLDAGSGDSYAFLLQTQGEGTFAQYGRVAALRQGDLTLCDCAAPHAYVAGEHSEAVVLRASAIALREHLPSPEPFCGRRLCAGEGLSDSAIALALSICAQLEAGMAPDAGRRIARNLLDLLSTAFAISFDSLVGASPVMSGRHARVKLHIEQRLKDPDLSPGSIAASLKLSPRYLRMIFGMSGVTVSAYVLRRRLEECARDLADPRLKALSITEIAFGWGFNSAPHFSRSFGERFGQSPRAYRRTALGRDVHDEAGGEIRSQA